MATKTLDELKDAVIAEMASDVLHVRAELEEIRPMVDQLKESLPGHFDMLRAGLIDTLEEIDQGIKEAGGERVDFVKGQLHVFITQAIEKSFAEQSSKIDEIIIKFEQRNDAAVKSLSEQYDVVSSGMQKLKSETKPSPPTALKVLITALFFIAIAGSSLLSWQLGSYKEAVYMEAFMSKLETEKNSN